MNRLLKNIPFGIRRAFSILPGNRERRWVFLVWLLYLLAFFAAMMIPSAQMWITDGLASLLSSPRYDLLLMGLAAILVNVVIVFFDKKKSDLWQNHINNTLSDSIYGDIIQKAARLKYKCFDNNEMYNSLTQTA
ncbi:MAG: hypothetical protein LBG76_03960, partial [Treponema sp.]|nr:hypothetical protein [Treponema sp.]